jgi:hypothetical protein
MAGLASSAPDARKMEQRPIFMGLLSCFIRFTDDDRQILIPNSARVIAFSDAMRLAASRRAHHPSNTP